MLIPLSDARQFQARRWDEKLARVRVDSVMGGSLDRKQRSYLCAVAREILNARMNGSPRLYRNLGDPVQGCGSFTEAFTTVK
jgi:hypothetical protein